MTQTQTPPILAVNKEGNRKFYVTYGIFYSMGILTGIPYLLFIMAVDYWMAKFRHEGKDLGPPGPPPMVRPAVYLSFNCTPLEGDNPEKSVMQSHFIASVTIAVELCTLISALISNSTQKIISPQKRITLTQWLTLILFLINMAFTKINTDSFQSTFYVFTIFMAALLTICSTLTLLSLFQLVIDFPLGYFATILSGWSLSGIISSLIEIFVLTMHVDISTYGLIYFGVGSFIVLLTTLFYQLAKRKSKYFIYNIGQSEGTTNVQQNSMICSVGTSILKRTIRDDAKWLLLSMVIIEGTTALIHPGFTALVVSIEKHSKTCNHWNVIYFVPVVTFLLFFIADLIGVESARRFQRIKSKPVIMGAALARLIFVPMFLLSNAHPRTRLPVVFGDESYIIIIILFGLSRGYLSTLCILNVPTVCKGEEKQTTIYLIILSRSIGNVLGSGISFLCIALI